MVNWLGQGAGRGLIGRFVDYLTKPNPRNLDNQPSFINYLPAKPGQKGFVGPMATAQPAPAKPTQPTPVKPVQTAPQQPANNDYASLRQFRTKNNQPVNGGLIQAVINAANNHGVDPRLSGALAIQESNWNAGAVGGTKPPGYGLYQLTPAANPNARWDVNRLTSDPAYNADIALAKLKAGLADAAKLGFSGEKAMRHALRTYNGGPNYYSNRIGWDGKRTVNQITKDYADSVLSYYNQ